MSRHGPTELVEIVAVLLRETEGAYLISDTGEEDNTVWLPKSKVTITNLKGNTVTVLLPEWLALKEGLI